MAKKTDDKKKLNNNSQNENSEVKENVTNKETNNKENRKNKNKETSNKETSNKEQKNETDEEIEGPTDEEIDELLEIQDSDDFDDDDDYFLDEDDLFGDFAIPDEWVGDNNLLINVEETVDSMMKEFNKLPYHVSSTKEIEAFFTFRVHSKKYKNKGIEETYYNLLIRTEDDKIGVKLAKALLEISGIDDVFCFDENSYKSKTFNLIGRFSGDIPAIVIYNCCKMPAIDTELPTAAARDANQKEYDSYINRWQEVAEYSKAHPQVPIIVCAKDHVYDHEFRSNPELYYRVLGHHIYLSKKTIDEVYKDCMKYLKEGKISLSKDFEPAFKKYFYTIYKTADLQDEEFIVDVANRIYSNYFRTAHEEITQITADCIPKYRETHLTPEEIMKSLDDLVGLKKVKAKFENIYKEILLSKQEEALLKTKPSKKKAKRYHMVFSGNPGTGKTTVAERLADLYFAMGIIEKNKVIVKKPTDFVSEWRGGDRKKVQVIIEEAYGGILFIDEAYGFISEEDKYKRAIEALLKYMETDADKLVIVMAGYKDAMRELYKTNEGMQSRFLCELEFEDYTLDELKKIFHGICEKNHFTMNPEDDMILEECISSRMTKEHFGNGREIDNIFEELKEVWSAEKYEKLQNANGERVIFPNVFTKNHFEKIMPEKDDSKLEELIGLDRIKQTFESFRKQVLYQNTLRMNGMTELPKFSRHMMFIGNPGTGKTKVAQIVANDLYAAGILKTNKLVKAERKDLVSPYPGETEKKTADYVKKARGGVLFIDEAYSLTHDAHGKEVMEVLITAMEDYKDDMIFVFAGYVKEMYEFLEINPGIQSRIGFTFHFTDYTPEELTKIYEQKMLKAGFSLRANVLKTVMDRMVYFHSAKNFGNGRFVEHVMQQTIFKRAERDYSKSFRDISVRDIPTVKELIETAPKGLTMYDPGKITDEEKKRTAYHELGHAIAIYVTNNANIPDNISIRNQAGSLGRVTFKGIADVSTEKEYKDLLVTFMAGRAAEIVLLGSSSDGCRSDFERCKEYARDMISKYAMGEIGVTKYMDLVSEADRRAREIVEANRDFIIYITDELIKGEEFSGNRFIRVYKEFNRKKKSEKSGVKAVKELENKTEETKTADETADKDSNKNGKEEKNSLPAKKRSSARYKRK